MKVNALVETNLYSRIVSASDARLKNACAYLVKESAENSFLPMKYIRRVFSFTSERMSHELVKYKGPLQAGAGYSLEKEFGNGWLKGTLDMPLSTTDVRTCAVLNLINENNNRQLLYHVLDDVSEKNIKEFISNEFPDFTKANIIGGDQRTTIFTLEKIDKVLQGLNPSAEKRYYHSIVENPEIVAYKGELAYMPGKKGQISFREVSNQYA